MKKKTEADPQSCASCRFFQQNDHDDAGYCRRHPPTPIVDEGELACVYPITVATDWCGEFARRLNS